MLDLFQLRIRKVTHGLSSAAAFRALRLGVGASVEHREPLARLNPTVVIDVGANRGQFALFARKQWPNAAIFAFEPLPAAGVLCNKVMAGDPKFTFIKAAIGDTRGVVKMNITAADDSSSLLALGEQHKSIYGSSVVAEEMVKCGLLLDFVPASAISGSTLMKIDTQGSELMVLRGSRDALDSIGYVYVELSFVELYDKQPLAAEVIAYLHDAGFLLSDVSNVSHTSAGVAIQADMLFTRKSLVTD